MVDAVVVAAPILNLAAQNHFAMRVTCQTTWSSGTGHNGTRRKITVKIHTKQLFRPIFAGIVCITLVSAVHAETVIGQWCDKQIPTMPQYNGLLEIVINDDGSVEMRRQYGDGSSGVTKLSEQAGGIYAAVGSGSGDKYRVVPSDGNLQLLDNDGLIRVAVRLENTPSPRECGF